MLSRASIAAPARSGVVRARRPSRTMHSSSAIADTDSTTSLDGASRNNFLSAGRASLRPSRPSAHAAEFATIRSRSPRRPISRTMTSGIRRAQRQAPARTPGSACCSSEPRVSAGRAECNRAAAATAIASVGPCTIAREIIPDTTCPASWPPIAASAESAAACSGTMRSAPNPAKRRQSAARAGTAPASRRRPASAASRAQSARLASGIAAITAASSLSTAARGCAALRSADGSVVAAASEKRSS